MADQNTIELQATEFEVPLNATLGYLHQIRNDRGYYEAKVAALHPPRRQLSKDTYWLLGTEFNEDGVEVADGSWIRFADRAEEIVASWQPSIGDRVLVLTMGQYGWESGWILRIALSYDQDALQAQDFEINGPATIFSGSGGLI
jgi:hypothetical protein